jgi:threonyl-tRNA synthetase
MNCPSHYLLYQSKKHSYRELPLRYARSTCCTATSCPARCRGLTRVRQFRRTTATSSARDQITGEVRASSCVHPRRLRTFGSSTTLKFATRPEQRIGDDELWDRAEAALKARSTPRACRTSSSRATARSTGRRSTSTSPTHRPQVAARHDPARLQRARALRPEVRRRGQRRAPAGVIHRASSGSFERFIAILIEHFAGAFPVWLAPEQVRVLPRKLLPARPVSVCGQRGDQGSMPVEEIINRAQELIRSRALTL